MSCCRRRPQPEHPKELEQEQTPFDQEQEQQQVLEQPQEQELPFLDHDQVILRWQRLVWITHRIHFKRRCWAHLGHHLNRLKQITYEH